MKVTLLVMSLFLCAASRVAIADSSSGTVILEDGFDRQEADPEQEQVGGGWSTNSKSRAKGVKQVDLVDGAMHITKAEVADHGVSVTHEAAFQDAIIRLRFKLGAGDDLGINIADMNEKSVHAGHICMAKVRPKNVEIVDLKTGRMNLKTRERKLADELTPEDQKRIKSRSKFFPVDLSLDEWHELEVQVAGETMSVSIDGQQVGQFASVGIGHPTKSRLRLAVNKSAWVDDVKIVRQSPGERTQHGY